VSPTGPRILFNAGRNALRLVLSSAPPLPGQERTVPATLDVGEGGRLLGVELDINGTDLLPPAADERAVAYEAATGTLYVEVEPETGAEANIGPSRSVEIAARLLADATGAVVEVEIPRRGTGYEITYPSGNR